jgi:hypothetical protein
MRRVRHAGRAMVVLAGWPALGDRQQKGRVGPKQRRFGRERRSVHTAHFHRRRAGAILRAPLVVTTGVAPRKGHTCARILFFAPPAPNSAGSGRFSTAPGSPPPASSRRCGGWRRWASSAWAWPIGASGATSRRACRAGGEVKPQSQPRKADSPGGLRLSKTSSCWRCASRTWPTPSRTWPTGCPMPRSTRCWLISRKVNSLGQGDRMRGIETARSGVSILHIYSDSGQQITRSKAGSLRIARSAGNTQGNAPLSRILVLGQVLPWGWRSPPCSIRDDRP